MLLPLLLVLLHECRGCRSIVDGVWRQSGPPSARQKQRDAILVLCGSLPMLVCVCPSPVVYKESCISPIG